MDKILLLFFLFPVSVFAQSKAEKEVLTLHYKKFEWLTGKNYDSLRGVLHQELAYIHSNGWNQNAAEVIDDLKSGKLHYGEVKIEEASSKESGNCVVITGKGEFTGTMEGKAFSIPLRYTEVYVLENNAWLLLQRHACRLP